MIEVKIVKDSIAPSEVRITTFVLTYPRFAHSEFLTHRMFSRNASSSRAIPVKKQIKMVIDNPAIPLAFTKNQKGMQGGEILADLEHKKAEEAWLLIRDEAVKFADVLADLEVHKQYANRILEPWAHITVVCTATDFANFFALRYHPDALPEMSELAKQMWEKYSSNVPQRLEEGQFHLPFIQEDDYSNNTRMIANIEGITEQELQVRRSVARCARVSYLTHEGSIPTIEQDLQLYNRLVGSAPIHASPTEHQAQASSDPNLRSGNFRGWHQYRQTLKNQNITEFKGPNVETN